MIVYSHEGGYGNVNIKEARAVVDRATQTGGRDKVTLAELLSDYECLLAVVEGRGAAFRHADGSETRRVKLYGG